ncbi:hypothetical protein CXG81DRAFT_6196, partial [Caulochytrium protostelioides]
LGFVVVALCWGVTNPLIKRGTRGIEGVRARVRAGEAWFLLTRWQYVVPLLLNLCGSSIYYAALGDADVSVAVPISNALTFAVTTVASWLLGEQLGSPLTFAGVVLVVIGVLL